MKTVISGGTGFIGKGIAAKLQSAGHEVAVWSRRASAPMAWDPLTGPPDPASLDGADAVIHLAGETVAQRWTSAVKQKIRDSRVLGTQRLVDTIAKVERKPRVLVCASAIGFYGSRGDEVLTETSAPGSGFLVDVCQEWEAEAERAAGLGLRVVKLRIGFVLGRHGGALGQMLPIFRLGLGGRLGSGQQWMPWIHVDDVVEMFVRAALDESVQGVWNATAPNPVSNAAFTQEISQVLHRPAIFPVPEFALRLGFGEFGLHMMDSARVVPTAALHAGYRFLYPEIGGALRNLLT